MDIEREKRILATWLLEEARFSTDGVAFVEELGRRFVASGLPLWRLRVAQKVANPLITAWGVIWHSDDKPTTEYIVPTEWLSTSIWIGSPFQYVTEHREVFRRRLVDLDPIDDHTVLHEIAADGGTDFLALPLEYADGTIQGMSVVTSQAGGFSDDQIALVSQMKHSIASAMEPMAIRRSMNSLLKAYLGVGPSDAVIGGSKRRGERSNLDAVVMFSDLRGFTNKSANWSDESLLEVLNDYFGIVVDAVHSHNGDVLKFLGDGVLAVFPIEDKALTMRRSNDALEAAWSARQALASYNEERMSSGLETIDFGTALHLGEVTYGNVGSPGRLDFTVIGKTVNIASRMEELTKTLHHPILCTRPVAENVTCDLVSLGEYPIRGISETQEIFAPH
ncbi:MAG: adenylate/guanylate cyclase domain-containing protein [Pseudomonadota bacterium]